MNKSEHVSSQKVDTSEWGTFKDSLRAPIHSWFTYPAGFSYKAVENSIHREGLTTKSVIYDPFMGSGTTNLVAKKYGINSVGVEAHPFVFDITLAKMYWTVRLDEVEEFIKWVAVNSTQSTSLEDIKRRNSENFPELITKCFLPEALFTLQNIRDQIKSDKKLSQETKRFLNTALICTLRNVSIAATGWPYIAPKKIKITSMSKNASEAFVKKVNSMVSDINLMNLQSSKIKSEHKLILGGSGNTDLKNESVDHIFTSPPYLNNFDYADRTRLEMYFMGEADSWGDISRKIRTKLMTSATTQISRNDERYVLREDIKKVSPEVFIFLEQASKKLAELRKVKGGKKSYDMLVTGYFNDIFDILSDNYRVLKKGSSAVYILGDSAPYGVHIPTDELIGKIGLGLGYKTCNIEILRVRGGKWASNPQRHTVPLRETVVILRK